MAIMLITHAMGVVGESGAGKSVTGLAVIGLIDRPGRIAGGEIYLSGMRIDHLPPEELRRIRGKRIGMIFQEPMTSLNPVFTVGFQIGEAVMLHLKKNKAESREHTIKMLEKVRIPSPHTRVDEYPHQMSGGMRQRIMIAMALACYPQLIIADEPTTALDVTVQKQVLRLLNPPPGCRFAARCRYVMPACTEAIPPLKEVAPGHKVACIL